MGISTEMIDENTVVAAPGTKCPNCGEANNTLKIEIVTQTIYDIHRNVTKAYIARCKDCHVFLSFFNPISKDGEVVNEEFATEQEEGIKVIKYSEFVKSLK